MFSIPKGYFTPDGYKGYVPQLNSCMLFATESDYLEYLSNEE